VWLPTILVTKTTADPNCAHKTAYFSFQNQFMNTNTVTRRILYFKRQLTGLMAFCLYYLTVTGQSVVVYEHQNFGGRSRPLAVGSHRFFNVEFNDMISSIRVPAGFGVIVFEHADNVGGYGISADLLEDCSDLSRYNFNDKISYITVFSIPNSIKCRWVRNRYSNGQFFEGHWDTSGIIYPGWPNRPIVSPAIPPNTPDTIFIDPNGGDRARAVALEKALNVEPRKVYGKSVPIVVAFCSDIDLSGYRIEVGPNRSLVATPSCARGPRNPGPRIYITENRSEKEPLFEIRGDNVRFSGFRLEGPSKTSRRFDNNRERAILVQPYDCDQKLCECPPDPIRNIEISNMEIYYWSGAGITVKDNAVVLERGRMFKTLENGVRIRGNYIHHNQHWAGFGYGVDIGDGAYALIEQNVFDFNRHAIAGMSSDKKKDFTGYTARDNLILFGGGVHCTESRYWPVICWDTHQIDMHGDGNLSYSHNNFQCGIAGETMIIQRNTIFYSEGLAIKIRGNPIDKVVVDNNVFAHGTLKAAVEQKGSCGRLTANDPTKPITVLPNNIYNARWPTSLGKIDLVGDGVAEELMTTGVTWWVRSGTTQQWRYLNTKPDMLSKLVFGDFDNDGKADDIAIRPPQLSIAPAKYTKDGKGPWVPLTQVTRRN